MEGKEPSFILIATSQVVSFWRGLCISLIQPPHRTSSALLHFFLLHHQQILIGHLLLEEVVLGPKEAIG